MEWDFAVSRPLVRRLRLLSGSCPSTRTFAPCFFQTPPRGGGPCIITKPSPPSGWPEDFHLQAAEHAQHTTKPLRGSSQTDLPTIARASGFPDDLICRPRYAPMHTPGMSQATWRRSVYDPASVTHARGPANPKFVSPLTQRAYTEHVSRYARHFGRSPAQLGPEEIHEYMVYLTNDRHLAPSSIIITAPGTTRILFLHPTGTIPVAMRPSRGRSNLQSTSPEAPQTTEDTPWRRR